jgi:hypothetical protein
VDAIVGGNLAPFDLSEKSDDGGWVDLWRAACRAQRQTLGRSALNPPSFC